MSSIYRYVVFAPGRQPTVEEVAQLREWSTATKQRFAVGINSEDGGLAFAFDASGFESARSAGGSLATLLGRWEVRGCEVHERLPFVKKPTALQPMSGGLLHASVERRSEPVLKRKQLAAQEALGRAGLKFHQTLEQHAWLHRVAQVMPYALIGLGGLLTIVAGIYAGQRLLNSSSERRQQTIQRVAGDAMAEPLMRKSKAMEPQRNEGHEDE